MTDSVTRQIPWLRVFVEGVVIVASILIAFALDASWEAYRQSQEERTILEGLRVDFTTSGRDLDGRMSSPPWPSSISTSSPTGSWKPRRPSELLDVKANTLSTPPTRRRRW